MDYLTAVIQDPEIDLSESTYSKYFNSSVKFLFKLPWTDVCNKCLKVRQNQHSLRKSLATNSKLESMKI